MVGLHAQAFLFGAVEPKNVDTHVQTFVPPLNVFGFGGGQTVMGVADRWTAETGVHPLAKPILKAHGLSRPGI